MIYDFPGPISKLPFFPRTYSKIALFSQDIFQKRKIKCQSDIPVWHARLIGGAASRILSISHKVPEFERIVQIEGNPLDLVYSIYTSHWIWEAFKFIHRESVPASLRRRSRVVVAVVWERELGPTGLSSRRHHLRSSAIFIHISLGICVGQPFSGP